MDGTVKIFDKPKYTLRWLWIQTAFIIGVSFILALVACGIDHYAIGREAAGLLDNSHYGLISQSTSYCFWLITITSMSLMLVEIAFRKGINYLQYGLISCALCLFYLLLLAMTEKMPFGASYVIVSFMTIGLISLFIKGITQNRKAIILTLAILCVEYGLMFLLICIGSMALLIGSLSLFVLLAAAMYFTLKLKVENEELILK